MGKILLVTMFCFGTIASADVLIDVQSFKDATHQGSCNAVNWWGSDVMDILHSRVTSSLNETHGIHVVEAEKVIMYHPQMDPNVNVIHKTGRKQNSNYSVRATVLAFDYCQQANSTQLTARVALSVVLRDNITGETLQSFVSQMSAAEPGGRQPASLKETALNTGIFKDSALGRALNLAVSDATSRIAKYFPATQLDNTPADYKVKLVKSGS